MSTNANTVAPSGEISGSMNAPETGNQKVRSKNVRNLPHGLNVGRICGVIDLGTHLESYPGKAPYSTRKIFIWFEHPQLKQIYYEGDTIAKSSTTNFEKSWSVNDKAALRGLIHCVAGRKMSYDEAKNYDLKNLLSKLVQVNVELQASKKDPTVFYEKVIGFFPITGVTLPVPFEPEIEPHYFFIDKAANGEVVGNNFLTSNYAKIPFWIKKKILDSDEAKAYAAKGGKFAELPKQEKTGTVIMIATDYTYEQYRVNWTDEMLVQHGKAKWAAPAATAAPAPVPAPGPDAAPAVEVQKIEMIATDFTYEQYRVNWTDEMLVQHGKARWVNTASAAAPAAAPSAAPAGPSAPAAAPTSPQAAPAAAAPANDLGGNFLAEEEHDDLPF